MSCADKSMLNERTVRRWKTMLLISICQTAETVALSTAAEPQGPPQQPTAVLHSAVSFNAHYALPRQKECRPRAAGIFERASSGLASRQTVRAGTAIAKSRTVLARDLTRNPRFAHAWAGWRFVDRNGADRVRKLVKWQIPGNAMNTSRGSNSCVYHSSLYHHLA